MLTLILDFFTGLIPVFCNTNEFNLTILVLVSFTLLLYLFRFLTSLLQK